MKKIALFLFAIMLLTILPIAVFAEAPTDDRGEYVCGDYEYNVVSETEKTCEIVCYTGPEDVEKLIIPQMLDGYKVVSIGGTTFWCREIKHIVIPDGVTSIKDSAFVWFGAGEYIDDVWHSTAEVTIPESVTYIGEDSFFCHMISRVYGYSDSYSETYFNNNNNVQSIDFIPLNVVNNIENDIEVIFANENVYDKNLAVNVEKLNAEDNSIMYNITLTVDGIEVQPENYVTVKIPIPETMDVDNVKVFREEKNGNYTDMNAVVENGYAVFSTEHFSKYILTTEELDASVESEKEEDKNTENNKNENTGKPITDVVIPDTDYNTSVAAAFTTMSICGMALLGLKKKIK